MNTEVINPQVRFKSGYADGVHPLAVLELNDGTYLQAVQRPVIENGVAVLLCRKFPEGTYKDAESYRIAELDVKRVIPGVDADKLEAELTATV